jgi:hypothetical protein
VGEVVHGTQTRDMGNHLGGVLCLFVFLCFFFFLVKTEGFPSSALRRVLAAAGHRALHVSHGGQTGMSGQTGLTQSRTVMGEVLVEVPRMAMLRQTPFLSLVEFGIDEGSEVGIRDGIEDGFKGCLGSILVSRWQFSDRLHFFW